MLKVLSAGAWSGAVGGTLLGFLFALLVVFNVPTISQDETNPVQENLTDIQLEVQEHEGPSALTYILGVLFIAIRYGGLGALIGAASGSFLGAVAGIMIFLTNQTGNAHYFGAVLSAVIMGLLCSQINFFSLLIGFLSGLFGGFISGKQFKSFFQVSV